MDVTLDRSGCPGIDLDGQIGTTIKTILHTAPDIGSPLPDGTNFIFVAAVAVIKIDAREVTENGDNIIGEEDSGYGWVGMHRVSGVNGGIDGGVSPVHGIGVGRVAVGRNRDCQIIDVVNAPSGDKRIRRRDGGGGGQGNNDDVVTQSEALSTGACNCPNKDIAIFNPIRQIGNRTRSSPGVVCYKAGRENAAKYSLYLRFENGHRNPTIFHQQVPGHCDDAVAGDCAHIGRRRRIARGDREQEGVADIGGGRVAVAGDYGDADRRLRHRGRRRRTAHGAGADRINGVSQAGAATLYVSSSMLIS